MQHRRWLLALGFSLGLAVAAAAGSIEVVGIGSAWASPDQVRIELGWSGVAREARDAIAEGDAAVRAIGLAITNSGVAPEDVRTLDYSLWREERWDADGTPRLVGYRVTHTLQVTLRRVEGLAAVIDAASVAGANQIGGISFQVAAREALEQQARAQAFAQAHARASELAALAGITLGSATRIVERATYDPYQGGRSYAMAVADSAGDAFAPGQQAVEVTLEVAFETHPPANR
jgi:uncharacterized protein YggE